MSLPNSRRLVAGTNVTLDTSVAGQMVIHATGGGGGGGTPDPHAPTHASGGSDPVTLDQAQVTGLTVALAGKVALTDPRLTDARVPVAHATTHQPGGSDAMAVDAVAATGSLRTLGTGATQAASGTDPRFTDARTPTAHKTTHEPGGSDPMAVNAAAGTGSLRTIGTTATSACAGNDARLTNARTPTAHATTHSSGGSDPVTVTALAGYPGGTTTFLRADATFAAPAVAARIGALGLLIDGAGSVITTGIKAYLEVPFACTILAATLLADVTGSIVVDIWKDTYANYPPTVADTITASAKPTLSSAIKSQNTTLTGWTTSIAAGDVLAFSVTSAATVTKVTVSLKVQVA